LTAHLCYGRDGGLETPQLLIADHRHLDALDDLLDLRRRCAAGQLLFKLADAPPQLAWVVGPGLLDCGGDALAQLLNVDGRKLPWRLDLHADLGRGRTIEGLALPHLDPTKDIEPAGRPEPGCADRQRWQRRHQLLALRGRAMHLDPRVDRLAVLWRDRPQRDQHLDLRQHVFVQHGAALCHQRDADATGSAAPHQVFDCAQHAFLALQWPLRRESVGLIEHQLERHAIAVVQSLGKVGHKAGLLALAEVREVEHGRDPLIDHQVGDHLSGGELQRHIAVVAAQDHDGGFCRSPQKGALYAIG
jgi:hypothetical protein